MPRLQITLIHPDQEPLAFFTGDLEPIEVGSILVAAMKRLAGEPPGWAIHVAHLPDYEQNH